MKFFSLVSSLLVVAATLVVVHAQDCVDDYTIRLAIAYDKSFCDANGGEVATATAAMQDIVNQASAYFASNERCDTVSLSVVYTYGDCDPDPDDLNNPFPSVQLSIASELGCTFPTPLGSVLGEIENYLTNPEPELKRITHDAFILLIDNDSLVGDESACSSRTQLCDGISAENMNGFTFVQQKGAILAREVAKQIGLSPVSEETSLSNIFLKFIMSNKYTLNDSTDYTYEWNSNEKTEIQTKIQGFECLNPDFTPPVEPSTAVEAETTETVDTAPAETSTPDTTPAETSPPDTTPAETSSPDTTPAETSTPETTPAETSTPETTPAENSTAETKPAETSTTDPPFEAGTTSAETPTAETPVTGTTPGTQITPAATDDNKETTPAANDDGESPASEDDDDDDDSSNSNTGNNSILTDEDSIEASFQVLDTNLCLNVPAIVTQGLDDRLKVTKCNPNAKSQRFAIHLNDGTVKSILSFQNNDKCLSMVPNNNSGGNNNNNNNGGALPSSPDWNGAPVRIIDCMNDDNNNNNNQGSGGGRSTMTSRSNDNNSNEINNSDMVEDSFQQKWIWKWNNENEPFVGKLQSQYKTKKCVKGSYNQGTIVRTQPCKMDDEYPLYFQLLEPYSI